MKAFFDRRLLMFLLVGVGNTLLGALLMLLLYNLGGMGYWGASALSYVLASGLSFVLNRRFTFSHSGALWPALGRFAANVALCYVLAYSAARPLAARLLLSWGLPARTVEQAAMLLGMVLFTLLNYIGQRFIVFPQKNRQKEEDNKS